MKSHECDPHCAELQLSSGHALVYYDYRVIWYRHSKVGEAWNGFQWEQLFCYAHICQATIIEYYPH